MQPRDFPLLSHSLPAICPGEDGTCEARGLRAQAVTGQVRQQIPELCACTGYGACGAAGMCGHGQGPGMQGRGKGRLSGGLAAAPEAGTDLCQP